MCYMVVVSPLSGLRNLRVSLTEGLWSDDLRQRGRVGQRSSRSLKAWKATVLNKPWLRIPVF